MKKLIYLFAVMFSLVLVSTSCEKGETVTPEPEGMTTQDLLGNWDFYSLTLSDGTVTYGCDVELLKDYDLVTLNLKDVTKTSMTLYTNCNLQNVYWEQEYSYTLVNNTITLENDNKFEIVNTTTFDGKTLKLKLISSLQNEMPIGGIFTLTK